MKTLYQKKMFVRFTLSGVILASSLMNIAPAQAWTQSSSSLLVNSQIRQILLSSQINYPKIMSEHLKNSNPGQNKTHEPQETPLLTPSKESSKTTVSGTVNSTKASSTSISKPTPKSPKQAQTAKVTPSTKAIASTQPAKSSAPVESILSKAKSLQGVPYLWGGTTTKGFDCSGFVQYVFAQSGIKLPRTAAEQYQVGTPVSRDQLKPGDLVFFSTYKPGASDVRIYIGGGLTIGSASDGVAIHSLSESYWTKHYLGARRVVKS